MLSINDYNNNDMIELCLTDGCDYEIVGVLDIDKKNNKKTLTLDVIHLGSKDGMQKLLLTEFVLYTKNGVYREKVLSPVVIEKNGVKVV